MVFMPQIRRRYPLSQLVHDLHIGPAFFGRLDDLGAGENDAVADPVMADVIHFIMMGDREDDIGHGGGRRHKQVGNGHKIEVLECLVGVLAVRPGDHGIRAHAVISPDGIRFACQDGPAEERWRDGHQPRDDSITGADHVFAFIRNQIGTDERPQAHDLRIAGIDVASRHFQVAADRHQAGQRPDGVKGVDVVFDGITPLQGSRLCFRVHPGSPLDRFGGNPGDFRHFFRGILFDMRSQFGEAIRVFLHEILVIEPFFTDNIHDPERQRLGRARTKLEPEIGLLGQFDPAGIDDNDLGPLF
ncbi:MAG: hypothetical protein CSYNP_04468 [Syntrophus sp. SKADARSKE-3]|nr:hypothetical protein [Syntrophus sp. SKADARSKE-3]